jgi:hypothetical protein
MFFLAIAWFGSLEDVPLATDGIFPLMVETESFFG